MMKLTILNGIPREPKSCFPNKWNKSPAIVSKMGINVKDHPNGMPHSAGRVIEKLAKGNVTCSIATPYKHHAKED